MFASSTEDRRFEHTTGQMKDYNIVMCCFSAKHATFRSKSKDWLALSQDKESEWSNMPTSRLLFQ